MNPSASDIELELEIDNYLLFNESFLSEDYLKQINNEYVYETYGYFWQ